MTSPVTMMWMGDAMVPIERHRWLADRNFVVGETYPIVVHEERSTTSHKHYFASVREAWKNLPHDAGRFATSEHLRKYALIKAGYYDDRSVSCDSPDEAKRVAAFIKPMDDFAIVNVEGCVVTVFTAKSQAPRHMDKKTFQESKQAVIEIVAQMIGVTPDQLSAQNRTPSQARSLPQSPEMAPELMSDAVGSGNLPRREHASIEGSSEFHEGVA